MAFLADLASVFAPLQAACLVPAVQVSASFVLPLVDRLELAVPPLAAEDRPGSCSASGSREEAWSPFSVAGKELVVAGEDLLGEVSRHLVVDLPCRLLAGRLVAQLAVEVVAAFARYLKVGTWRCWLVELVLPFALVAPLHMSH